MRDGKLFNIYFPKLPFCKMLQREYKEEFHENVQRTSTKTKLTYLMKQSPFLITVMKHEERLRLIFKRNLILSILGSHGKLWEQLGFISTLSLNFIILVSYSQLFLSPSQQSGD